VVLFVAIAALGVTIGFGLGANHALRNAAETLCEPSEMFVSTHRFGPFYWPMHGIEVPETETDDEFAADSEWGGAL